MLAKAYQKYLYIPRPVSKRYPMDVQHRAKQFAPFAALRGFEEIVRKQEILYEQRKVLSEEQKCGLDGGRLPYHVRLLLDEFSNIGQIPKFDKLIATIRSREISASIILQSQSQLKTIYKDAAETITGNCVRPEVASAI